MAELTTRVVVCEKALSAEERRERLRSLQRRLEQIRLRLAKEAAERQR